MEKDEAVIYLNQVRVIRERIIELAEKKEQVEAIAEKMTQDFKMTPPGGSASNKVESCVIKMQELEKKLETEMRTLRIVQAEVYRTIVKAVASDNGKRVLIDRYVVCMRWKDIAAHHGKTKRWAYKWHEKAVKELEKNT